MIRVGLIIADEPGPGGFARIPQIAAEVEELGSDALWFTDHVFWHRPTAEPITAMAMAVPTTSRMTLGPLVLQLPLRRTAPVAKSLSFVDSASGGRVIAGVGIGEHLAEFEAAGVGDAFARRGRLLDEGIADLRRCWDGDVVEGLSMGPVRQIPIWVGGRSTAARNRAATVGDAWIPHLCPLDWYREQVPKFLEDVEAAGRTGSVRPAVGLMVHVTETSPNEDPLAWASRLYGGRLPPKVFDRVVHRGSAAQVAEVLAAYAAAGAGELALVATSDDPVAHLAALLPLLDGLRSA